MMSQTLLSPVATIPNRYKPIIFVYLNILTINFDKYYIYYNNNNKLVMSTQFNRSLFQNLVVEKTYENLAR